MALKLAILGLDPLQRDWLDAVATLRAAGDIELVAVGHRSQAAAKDTAAVFKSPDSAAPPVFDDLRLLLKEAAPQLLLMDRPSNATLDFLLACITQEIAILSLGPPVETLAEAQTLGAALPPRTHLLYTWPRFVDAPASRHCAQADDFMRPIRFAAATWMGINYALAKSIAPDTAHDLPVRSLSVLAWDALSTLMRLAGMPTSIYAAIRGTIPSGNNFADLSGAASITARFADDAAASIVICDRAPVPTASAGITHPDLAIGGTWNRRELLLWGAGGTLKLTTHAYEFRDPEGELIDAGPPPLQHGSSPSPRAQALETLREFLHQYTLPSSPHRGWDHHLEDTAAAMEALIVSHRTGQAESPEHFRRLRR